jgi:ATP-dependent protease Clp ATPase subunit
MENLMMPMMYEIPSKPEIAEVVINQACVLEQGRPDYVIKELIDPTQSAETCGELPS